MRRKKVENETTTWYNYFGYNVIAEEDGTGGGIGAGGELVQTYVHDPGKAIGTILQSSLNDTYFWYHQDQIGSTRLLTAPDRATAASYEYTPYGEPLSLSGWFWVNSYMFTGKELDYATGDYFFPARYYNPSLGRWTQRRSPYSAFGNNPVNGQDDCPPTDQEIEDDEQWCRDDENVFHKPYTCYRSLPGISGQQCCYDGGKLVEGEGTPDVVSPAGGRNEDGSCKWDPCLFILHVIADVLTSTPPHPPGYLPTLPIGGW